MGTFDFAAAYNKGAIAWALVLLLPPNWRLRRWEQGLCVIVVWMESICLNRFKDSVMLVHVLVISILLLRKNRSLKQSLTGAMQAVFLAWGCTMFSGSVMTLLFPGLFGGMLLSCIASTVLILFAWAWRLAGKTRERKTEVGIMYRAAIELVIMAYFSFVLPAFHISNPVTACILILSLLALLAIVYAFMCKMNTLALDYQRMRLEEKEIERRYRKTMEIQHYFNKQFDLLRDDLSRKDFHAATQHFESEIRPLYRELTGETHEMKLPSERLSRLLKHSVKQIQALPQIIMDIQVEENVLITEEDKLVQIMTVWLDNAVNVLEKQAEGFFRLRIKMAKGGRLLILVANSFDSKGEDYLKRTQNTENDKGFGLAMAQKLIHSTPSMTHDSYISNALDYHKPLFIHQLLIG